MLYLILAEFSEIKGFSYRNLRQIRQWFAFYAMPSGNWKQPVSNLEYELSRLAPKTVKGMMPTVEEIEKRLTEMEER